MLRQAFDPGSPASNIHQTTIRYSLPFPWHIWRRSINEAADLEARRTGHPGTTFDFISGFAFCVAPIFVLCEGAGN